MARTFVTTRLTPVNVSSPAWALVYVRSKLRDYPNDEGAWPKGSLSDEEILVQLELDAVLVGTKTLYPAHHTAANLLEGNPERVLSYALSGESETYPNPSAAAAALRRSGSSIDRLIQAASQYGPVQGVQVGY